MFDFLDVGQCRHSWPLPKALAKLKANTQGVAVLLNCGEGIASMLEHLDSGPVIATGKIAPDPMDLRTYGVGSQILRELGVMKMKLLGAPRRMPSMIGYGLEITSFVEA